jgi:hypothetical protein
MKIFPLSNRRAILARAALGLLLLLALGAANVAAADAPLPAPMSAEQAFDDLRTNARLSWLVRMVPYDPADPVLAIDKLTHLGAPHEGYTFVADYAELRGYTAEQAARLAGGAIRPGQHISAIIFPLLKERLYPANVRGMLQVVQEIDKQRAGEPDYRASGLDNLFSPAELADLDNRKIASWAWDNYREYFASYSRVFEQLRKDRISAIDHIGHIGRDWCPAGCSRLVGHDTPLRPETMTLKLSDGSPVEIERFGVRVFLIRNLPIDTLAGRMLIDFDKPNEQIVPYFPLNASVAPTPIRSASEGQETSPQLAPAPASR